MHYSTSVDTVYKPAAVKGMATAAPKTMTVTISDSNEEETIEARKRKGAYASRERPTGVDDAKLGAD